MPNQRHFDEVAKELRASKLDDGLWARAIATAGGHQDFARALYIKYRAEQIAVEGRKRALWRYAPWAIGWGLAIFVIMQAYETNRRARIYDTPRIAAVTPFPTPTTPTAGSRLADAAAIVAERRLVAPIVLPDTRAIRSFANGRMLATAFLTGKGTLKVINGTPRDAAVKIVDRQDWTRPAFFYVRAHDEYTVSGVPDGSYRILFSTGIDWDDAKKEFTKSPSFVAFEEPFPFSTRVEERGGSNYEVTTRGTITLNSVAGGNADTEKISPAEFTRF